MALESTPARPPSRSRSSIASADATPPSVAARLPAPVDSGALRLLACGAFVVLLIGLVVLPRGPSESDETLSWVLSFAVALPCGLALATYQARLLSAAAPAATARALAMGLGLLSLALLLRRAGVGGRLHHGLLVVAAAGALVAPILAARRWRDLNDDSDEIVRAIAFVSITAVLLLFVPFGALRPETLIPALLLAGAAFPAIRLSIGQRGLPVGPRRALDVVLCGMIALVVIQLPDIVDYSGNVMLHHGFFLGPANDVLHGHPMLSGAWSQYGTGVVDALALAFTVMSIGFGTFALIIVAVTVAQYLCVYLILRLAGLGQVLTLITVAVAVAGNLFSPLDAYVVFPSDSALRFGLPYLVILCAVLAARYPAQARPARLVALAVLAISAVWSFEAFTYCGATYGALVLVEAICAGTDVVRRVVRGAALGLAVSAAAVALFSFLTLSFSGHLDWKPYIEYLWLYSVGGFGQMSIEFFSAGPLMAAAIFLSAVTLIWLARDHPQALAPPMRAALVGFTGLAVVTFTYYLGRSHPNNLLVLLVPVVALGGLWVQVLLTSPAAQWRTASAAVIALGLAMIAVASWPSIELKAKSTALALAAPGGESPREAIERLSHNPVLDARAPTGAVLLAGYLSPGAPALVLAEPELTTEILMRADRRNLLPVSHLPEDALIESSWDRVRAAIERIPNGTILLKSPVSGPLYTLPDTGAARESDTLRRAALSMLRQRFDFRLVLQTPEGLEFVRLSRKR